MIDFPDKKEEPEEPGRNDPCPCKSGKKYKKCCEKKKKFLESKVDLSTMLKLLYCFVHGLEGRSIIITKRTVDEYCKGEWQKRMNIRTEIMPGKGQDVECYIVKVEPEEEESKIIKPSGRIILPGQG